ncbi:MAG: tRNA preQ1(34) S-adenosylmethionine ribosyltransferase-isomerase QueA [Candidatus Tectomicrobia bacterium]|nr:tRNA preQ1(34) S-adenosylmethionine ribosyltransferase-isomerase QueA [Candidatus Tectomicrobia bacterium]
MKLADFDYFLPPGLIAQQPLERRDASRLLVVHRQSGRLEHRSFEDFPSYPAPGDAVVVNDTKVVPVRLLCRRSPGGGRTELFLLSKVAPHCWRALARPRARLRPGTVVLIGDWVTATIERLEAQTVLVRFPEEVDVLEVLEQWGRMPLPPYVGRDELDPEQARLDRERYQTVYAASPGSVAAPTAGLHFSPRLLRALDERGVSLCTVTLHVGYGTFQPIRSRRVEDHAMHAELAVVPAQTVARLRACRARRGTVWVVGTTTVRALESAGRQGDLSPFRGATDLFIYPGHHFTCTDHLLTNFHLPRSSLFIMVCAFAGRELMLRAYHEAIGERYRFYSFGDAMLII